jgi:hypothetical protein
MEQKPKCQSIVSWEGVHLWDKTYSWKQVGVCLVLLVAAVAIVCYMTGNVPAWLCGRQVLVLNRGVLPNASPLVDTPQTVRALMRG